MLTLVKSEFSDSSIMTSCLIKLFQINFGAHKNVDVLVLIVLRICKLNQLIFNNISLSENV